MHTYTCWSRAEVAVAHLEELGLFVEVVELDAIARRLVGQVHADLVEVLLHALALGQQRKVHQLLDKHLRARKRHVRR